VLERNKSSHSFTAHKKQNETNDKKKKMRIASRRQVNRDNDDDDDFSDSSDDSSASSHTSGSHTEIDIENLIADDEVIENAVVIQPTTTVSGTATTTTTTDNNKILPHSNMHFFNSKFPLFASIPDITVTALRKTKPYGMNKVLATECPVSLEPILFPDAEWWDKLGAQMDNLCIATCANGHPITLAVRKQSTVQRCAVCRSQNIFTCGSAVTIEKFYTLLKKFTAED
jgi:hypothetical protein